MKKYRVMVSGGTADYGGSTIVEATNEHTALNKAFKDDSPGHRVKSKTPLKKGDLLKITLERLA